MKNKKTRLENIILVVTGSIASYKSAELLRLLKKEGLDVQVILTKEAREFIQPLTFQALSGRKVYQDLFEPIKEYNPVHVSLSSWADLVVVYPATANFISKVACGVCDDLALCVIFSTKSNTIFCPAMDENMYLHPVIQDNIKRLEKIGYIFLGPQKGRLISGKRGLGHIVDPAKVLDKINTF